MDRSVSLKWTKRLYEVAHSIMRGISVLIRFVKGCYCIVGLSPHLREDIYVHHVQHCVNLGINHDNLLLLFPLWPIISHRSINSVVHSWKICVLINNLQCHFAVGWLRLIFLEYIVIDAWELLFRELFAIEWNADIIILTWFLLVMNDGRRFRHQQSILTLLMIHSSEGWFLVVKLDWTCLTRAPSEGGASPWSRSIDI